MRGHCFHEFSWPRRAPDSRYYQVCILCNSKYEYDWQTMRRIEPEAATSESVTSSSGAQLKLLLELESAPRVFFRNLFDLLVFRSTSHISTTSRPAPFWSDVFVHSRVPWWRFVESIVCHVLAIAAVLIGSRAWTQLEEPQPLRISRKDYVTYYTPSRSFPAMKARVPDRIASRNGAKSSHPAGIRVTAERGRKALTAPNIKLAGFAALKLAMTTAVAPAAPAAVNSFNRRPQLTLPAGWMSAIAPTPDLNQVGRGGRAHSYQISVIAPAPGVEGISSGRGMDAPNEVVVSPLPSLQGSMRQSGDVNIGRAHVIEPAPSLPVDEQHAGLGMAHVSLGELTASAVAPAPLVQGHESIGGGRAGPVSRTGLQVVEPAPSVSAEERYALGIGRGSLGGGLAVSVVSPPPSILGDGTLASGRGGRVTRTGVQVVGPAPSLSGREQAAGLGRASLGGDTDSVIPPAPSIQGEGVLGNGRAGSSAGSGSQVVPPTPSVQNTYASASLGRPTVRDFPSTVARQPKPLFDDRRPIQELQLRLVALASATPESSYFSNYEVFIAERRISKDESQLIKLVYVSLPYQRRLSQYAVDNSHVYKLRVTRDQTCDESLLQMTWTDTDSRSSTDRNSMLPCYRTTADDYRKAVTRGR
jgi:hypothetical protein